MYLQVLSVSVEEPKVTGLSYRSAPKLIQCLELENMFAGWKR